MARSAEFESVTHLKSIGIDHLPDGLKSEKGQSSGVVEGVMGHAFVQRFFITDLDTYTGHSTYHKYTPQVLISFYPDADGRIHNDPEVASVVVTKAFDIAKISEALKRTQDGVAETDIDSSFYSRRGKPVPIPTSLRIEKIGENFFVTINGLRGDKSGILPEDKKRIVTTECMFNAEQASQLAGVIVRTASLENK